MRRLALAAPGVAFRLESDGRVVFDLPRAGPRARGSRRCSAPDAAAALLPVARRARRAAASRASPRSPGGDARHRRGAGADGERPAGRRSGAEDRGARGLPRRDRRRAASGGGAVSRPAARGAGRERPPGQGRAAVPRRRRGARAGDRRAGPGAGGRRRHGARDRRCRRRARRCTWCSRAPGGGMRALPRARLPRGLAGGRAPGFGRTLGRGARCRLAAAPAARVLAGARPRCPTHPLGAPVAQVLDTYIIAVAARRLAGAGRPARRA